MQNPVDYFEIGSPDPSASRTFYSHMFNWPIADTASPVGYRMIGTDAGGLWDTSQMGGKAWAIFYVHVEDVMAAITKAEELGATIALPLTDGGNIEFAHIIDPQGNRFGVWQEKTPATTQS